MISLSQFRLSALLLFSIVGAVLTPGCRQAHTEEAQVRLINAVPDAGSLTVAVGWAAGMERLAVSEQYRL